MKTTLEVTVKIEVDHPENSLDENSVKALVNIGTSAMFHNRRILSTIGDEEIHSISVSTVKLKQNGKQQALSLYGTDAISWNR